MECMFVDLVKKVALKSGLEVTFPFIWVKCESSRSGDGWQRPGHCGVVFCWAL